MHEKKNQSTGNTIIDEVFELDWLLLFQRVFGFLWSMICELYFGITRGTIPFLWCFFAGVLAAWAVRYHWDYLLLYKLKIAFLYPKALWNSQRYFLVMHLCGFLGWSVYRAARKIGMRNRATHVFENAGLKTRTGQLPKLLAEESLGDGTHRMRINHVGLTKQEFEKAKGNLESSMRAYVSSIEEDRARGIVDITYSKKPIPDICELNYADLEQLRPGQFYVGAGHAGLREVSLAECPHLLVAGETGSGKSTFLHQFITGLYRKDPSIEMTLIDLKGGLEFIEFSELPGIHVVTDREEAGRRLSSFPEIISRRMRALREARANSIENLSGASRKGMNRHVIIIDEAAEMFLSSEDNAAKAVLSQIARQGRALGLHLVVATQRPDARALEPQIKANLTGILCFKMLNDASSMTVLGNGKATDLPPIPGRALWKMGPSLVELQVPWIEPRWAKELLEEYAKQTRDQQSQPKPTVGNTNNDRFEPLQ